jgi:hypothetical protein
MRFARHLLARPSARTTLTRNSAPQVESRTTPVSNQARLRAMGAQPTLQVSAPDDAYEREADRVAAQVMSMPAAPRQPLRLSPVGISAQRKCAECEEEERTVQRKATCSALPSQVPADPVPGMGTPLPPSLRGFFEPRFGRDLSDVRIHTGGEAAAVASSLRARAFTYGRDIVFGSGEYAPDTLEGQRVLAHELTHVAQQARGPAKIQRLGDNPGCTDDQAAAIHQAIYNARGWLNKAIKKMETTPTPAAVLSSLRRNFGPTYGVAANISLIVGRLRRAYRELSTIPIGCADATDATCATSPCGYAFFGSHAATICTNVTLPPASTDAVYQAGCVLHESLHAAYTNFTFDEYSGWHGHSSSTATYPGTGTEPLLNPDSYTTLTMDLS